MKSMREPIVSRAAEKKGRGGRSNVVADKSRVPLHPGLRSHGWTCSIDTLATSCAVRSPSDSLLLLLVLTLARANLTARPASVVAAHCEQKDLGVGQSRGGVVPFDAVISS